MQLVAYGAQDIYLTGNPQITFFKVVYRRHTNFSMEAIQQTVQGSRTCANGSNTTGSVTISRNGDLVYKVYVTSNTEQITRGDRLVKEVDLEIGGQLIDRHYEEWNQIWNELATPASKALALKAMTSCTHGGHQGSGDTINNTGPGLVQVPLNFWFCRNPGLALPLIALQYHEVKLRFTWGDGASTEVGALAACDVYCDYIYLDTDERRRFAQVSHEYLIEQVQKQSLANKTANKLNFNHPVKELIWTSPATNAYATAQLKLNGHDRFANQQEEYFQLRQPYDYHTSVPHCNIPRSHHGFLASSGKHQTITVGDASTLNAVHTNGQGLATAACVTTGLTWVTVGGTSAVLSEVPGAADVIANASGSASCFLVGALAAVSGIRANSLRVDDEHEITVSAPGKNHPQTFTATAKVKFIVLSNLAATDTIAETSGILGPLHLGDSGATENLLAAGGAVGDITNATGGAVLVCYDQLFTFAVQETNSQKSVAFNLSSGNDNTRIKNNTSHDEIGAGSNSIEAATSLFSKRINVYSFALKPEEHQPSGTCNFSRIDNAQLVTGVALATTDNIYAVNYNVLRIMSGMGGLAYSN